MNDTSVAPTYPLDFELINSSINGTALVVRWPFSLEVKGIKSAFTHETGLPNEYALGPIARITSLIPMSLGISEIRVDGLDLRFQVVFAGEGSIDEFLSRIRDFQNRGAVEVSKLHEKYDGCTCGDPGRPNHKVYPPKP
jgi:hypothetical protein